MPDPTSPILDDFNRASLDADWSTFAEAGSPLGIVSSTQLRCGTGASYTGSYYDVASYDRPCEAFIDVPGNVAASNNYWGLMLLTAPNGTTSDGYKVGTNAGDDDLVVYRVDNGVETEIARYAGGMANGIQVWLSVEASDIVLYTDEGVGFVERARVTDTTYSGPFFITIDAFDPGQDEIRLDNLGGGEVTAGGLQESGTVTASVALDGDEALGEVDALEATTSLAGAEVMEEAGALTAGVILAGSEATTGDITETGTLAVSASLAGDEALVEAGTSTVLVALAGDQALTEAGALAAAALLAGEEEPTVVEVGALELLALLAGTETVADSGRISVGALLAGGELLLETGTLAAVSVLAGSGFAGEQSTWLEGNPAASGLEGAAALAGGEASFQTSGLEG